VVRRPEKDDLVYPFPPDMPGLFCVAAGAARDEPVHAVADDDEVLALDRPFGDERLERVGEGAAVDRDVQV
jgi:hypothetical protein